MKYDILQKAHFDACTASHDSHFQIEGLEQEKVIYELRDKGNGLKWWYSVMGEHDTIEKIVNRDDCEVSRIDVALDVRIPADEVEKIFENEGKDFPVKYIRYDRYVASKTGRTLYFGTGDKLLRIYEKGKQLKLTGYDDWVRFEFQLKGRMARQALEKSRNPEELFEMLQAKYLYNLLSCVDCEKVIEFKQPAREDLEYFFRVVRPYLSSHFESEDMLKIALAPVFAELRAKKRSSIRTPKA